MWIDTKKTLFNRMTNIFIILSYFSTNLLLQSKVQMISKVWFIYLYYSSTIYTILGIKQENGQLY